MKRECPNYYKEEREGRAGQGYRSDPRVEWGFGHRSGQNSNEENHRWRKKDHSSEWDENRRKRRDEERNQPSKKTKKKRKIKKKDEKGYHALTKGISGEEYVKFRKHGKHKFRTE